MGFTLFNLFKAGLLVSNSVTILHKDRLLRRYGWAEVDPALGAASLKNQAIGLINAMAYLRVPLIALNLLTCFFEMLLG